MSGLAEQLKAIEQAAELADRSARNARRALWLAVMGGALQLIGAAMRWYGY